MRILSGIQPSGELTLGNYFGMMRRMVRYQEDHDLFAFIVNFHAQTSVSDGAVLKANTLQAAVDFMALGLDPERCTLWVQSDIPEIHEFAWYLGNFTPMGLLERCHSYKDKTAKGIAPNHGLFAYPVLMAADILLFGADRVPVGRDQKQHVEVTRDVALKFNNQYGDVLVLPEPDIDDAVAVVPGLDGQKMSKSYGNTVLIFEPSEKALRKKIMRIPTDSTPVEEPKDPDKCLVFALTRLFLDQAGEAELRGRYGAGGLAYGTVKQELFERIRDHFAPYAARRAELLADKGQVERILAQGAEKARAVAMPLLQRVRQAVGTAWRS